MIYCAEFYDLNPVKMQKVKILFKQVKKKLFKNTAFLYFIPPFHAIENKIIAFSACNAY